MQKRDIAMLKTAFKKEYYEMNGVMHVVCNTDGKVVSKEYQPYYKMDESDIAELVETWKQGFTGIYGKNMFDCKSTCNNGLINVMRSTWETMTDDTYDVSKVYDDIIAQFAENMDGFVSEKQDIPTNYIMHICQVTIMPTANDKKLAKKKEKAEGAEEYTGYYCYDYPMIMVWVDTYENNAVTTLVRTDDEMNYEYKRMAYIGKSKAPLFTMAYPNLTADGIDFESVYINCKTDYKQILSTLGSTFSCDIETQPTGYALKGFESIMNIVLGGCMTYEMYSEYDALINEKYAENCTQSVDVSFVKEVITKLASIVGVEITECDEELIETMYAKVFTSKVHIADLLRNKHTLALSDYGINITVANSNLSNNVKIIRQPNENSGIETYLAIRIEHLNTPMQIDNTSVMLYNTEFIAEKEIDTSVATDTTISEKLKSKVETYLKYFTKGVKKADVEETADETVILPISIQNTLSKAEEDYENCCNIAITHNECNLVKYGNDSTVEYESILDPEDLEDDTLKNGIKAILETDKSTDVSEDSENKDAEISKELIEETGKAENNIEVANEEIIEQLPESMRTSVVLYNSEGVAIGEVTPHGAKGYFTPEKPADDPLKYCENPIYDEMDRRAAELAKKYANGYYEDDDD